MAAVADRPRPPMAKFVAQGGGFKLPFSEGACDLRDSFQCRLGGGSSGGALLFKSPFDVRGNGGSKRKLARWSCRASFVGRKGRRLGGEEEEGFKDVDEEDDGSEEFERDELSCCRGLVLDISYRLVIFWFHSSFFSPFLSNGLGGVYKLILIDIDQIMDQCP